jgi:hypothetical protein
LISSAPAAIGVHLIAVACFAGLDDFVRIFPVVPLRSTPGFTLSPAFAGWGRNVSYQFCSRTPGFILSPAFGGWGRIVTYHFCRTSFALSHSINLIL